MERELQRGRFRLRLEDGGESHDVRRAYFRDKE